MNRWKHDGSSLGTKKPFVKYSALVLIHTINWRLSQQTIKIYPMDLTNHATWVFELDTPMGGARATTYQDTLEGSELSGEQRLAREAIQNSVDATLPGRKTEILVWDKALLSDEITQIERALQLGSSDSPVARLEKLGLVEDNSLYAASNGTGEIRVTIIEDRNTFGLGFDEVKKKDRFRELCLYIGQHETDVDPERGGSYGFGKTVYQKQSDCHTFFVYSVFEPKAETSGNHARFFGCSLFNGHTSADDRSYSGRAWFGIPDLQDGYHVCNPIVDEDAHAIAKAVGFLERRPDELGTSIMIFGSDVHMDDFKEAVEDYWWPRLESDQLNVELWKDEHEVPAPEPLLRPELGPFIRCYHLVEDDIPPEGKEQARRLNASGGKQRGLLALKGLLAYDRDFQDDPENDTSFRNTVALIRSGPRMVVQYLNTGGRQTGDFAGTFVSHPDSELAFHLSEPPSHDSWNPNSDRLKPVDPGYRELVKSTLDIIKRTARGFQKNLNPVPPPRQVQGSKKLEEILGRVMSARGLGPRLRPSENGDPFQIRIHDGRNNSESGSTVTAKIEIALRDDAVVDQLHVDMELRPTIVLDDNRRRDSSERLNWSSISKDGASVEIEAGAQIPLIVTKEIWTVIEAESEVFDRDLYADLQVSIRAIDARDP